MALLDQMLQSGQPSQNPELEQMIARLMQSGGVPANSAMQSANSAVNSSAPPSSANPIQVANGGQQSPGSAASSSGSVGSADGGGANGPENNQTYQALVARGVPAPIALAAMQNPQLLQQIIQKLYAQGQGAGMAGPAEAPGMVQNPTGIPRQSAPPLGGGGGKM